MNTVDAVTELGAFDAQFKALTGHGPFPWQRKLYSEFIARHFRKDCDIPTGLGKTSVIAVWLLALARHAQEGKVSGFPRRLVYVVNRRTVVDQATREVERIRKALDEPGLKDVKASLQSLGVRSTVAPLAISTLRGQFADNAEWRDDPARPAVVSGTVDMIGSRLLFAGYGCGFKTRPLHAGFLGQDSLLIHDEAHLEPAFQALLSSIEAEQLRSRDFRPLRVMALTATSRELEPTEEKTALFTVDDHANLIVKKRVFAKKELKFHDVEDAKAVADRVAALALNHKNSRQAILIYLRHLDDVESVYRRLNAEAPKHVQRLTGTLRGRERNRLARTDPVFGRFMPSSDERAPDAPTLQDGTVFLVCTSAGEVGVNISADHLICDLSTFDSMAQRLGRVNRFGDGDARVDVVHDKPGSEAYEKARETTLKLLKKVECKKHGTHNASPDALRRLPVDERQAAFAPTPEILPTSDILFDAWALTTIRERLPGRPPVTDWLHGVAEWEPPETQVAWREEVALLSEGFSGRELQDLMDDYPLKPHELLRDRTKRVLKQLELMATRAPDVRAWVIDAEGDVRVVSLGDLIDDEAGVANSTVVLSPRTGGLTEDGALDGREEYSGTRRNDYDVADQWMDTDSEPRRVRVWDNETEIPKRLKMRLVRVVDTRSEADEGNGDPENDRRYWRWYARPQSADDDGTRTARVAQELEPHLQSAGDFAQRIVGEASVPGGLALTDPEATAIVLGARKHDLGKHRKLWQSSIDNHDYPRRILAKSGGSMRTRALSDYRHEFGSLLDLSVLPEFQELKPEMQDLALHLVAAHHGRARPHFPAEESFDPERPEDVAIDIAREVPHRFSRLRRKYGRWGLAYLESIVRAADILASQENNGRSATP